MYVYLYWIVLLCSMHAYDICISKHMCISLIGRYDEMRIELSLLWRCIRCKHRHVGLCSASRPSHSFSLARITSTSRRCRTCLLLLPTPLSTRAHFVLSRIDFDRRPDVRACVLRLARSFSSCPRGGGWYASFSLAMRACHART